MAMWRGYTGWTPPEQVVELVTAIAAGELDAWSGRFLRAGKDDLDVLRAADAGRTPPAGSACSPTGTTTRSPEPSRDQVSSSAQCGRRIRQNG